MFVAHNVVTVLLGERGRTLTDRFPAKKTVLTEGSRTKSLSVVVDNAFVHFEALKLIGTHLGNEWYGRSC